MHSQTTEHQKKQMQERSFIGANCRKQIAAALTCSLSFSRFTPSSSLPASSSLASALEVSLTWATYRACRMMSISGALMKAEKKRRVRRTHVV